jgi:hypothetical protein
MHIKLNIEQQQPPFKTWDDKELTLGRKYLWKVLYKECSFGTDPLTNMAATGNSCF